ncbi:MAG TPA: FAD-dependent oxidoreductase, partial [Polyangiaceae bacterium]|nr:FAD-dependent oxidoreductase [Polyangiaceae bacterium]
AVGGVTFDEWGIDGVRLCMGSAVDAIERGAKVHVHTTVMEVMLDGERVRGVRWRDRISGETGQTTARVVVNATGAWAPVTATLAGLEPRVARIRPGKGIHVFLDRRLTNYAIATTAIDGRQVFLMPWQNMSVLGTTDDDYYGDLDEVLANGDEVRYLMQAVARVFPSVSQARAIGTWGGVRPTLYGWGVNEDKLSREHEIVDHKKHGADGLYSMIGGKLASYRIFAEEMTDVVAERLGNTAPKRTHSSPLPGGDETVDPFSLCAGIQLDALAASRLEYRHGSRSPRVIERIKRCPPEARVVCDCEPVTEAEVRYVVEGEMAKTVDDVARRTRLGLGSCGGMRCALRCGAILADALDADPSYGQRSALTFLRGAAARRASAVGSLQARQEALSLATLSSQLGFVEKEER